MLPFCAVEIQPFKGKVHSRIAEVAAKVPHKGYLFLVQCQNQLPFLHVDKDATQRVQGFADEVDQQAGAGDEEIINICYGVKTMTSMRDVVEWMMKKTTETPLPSGDHFKCEAMKMGVLRAIDKSQNVEIKKFIGNSHVTRASREAFMTVFTDDKEAQDAADLCLRCQLSVWVFKEGKFIIRRLDWTVDWTLHAQRARKVKDVSGGDDKGSLRGAVVVQLIAVLRRSARSVCLFLRTFASQSRGRIVSQCRNTRVGRDRFPVVRKMNDK